MLAKISAPSDEEPRRAKVILMAAKGHGDGEIVQASG
jgi:hypothetical protein